MHLFLSIIPKVSKTVIISSLFFAITIILLCPTTLYGQTTSCGVTSDKITICNLKNVPSAYQDSLKAEGIVDLFKAFNTSVVKTGKWKDINNSGGLDVDTGLLNLYVIRKGGTFIYQYDYSTSGNNCSVNVTLDLNNYTGESTTPVFCKEDGAASLYQYMGNNPSPYPNGIWVDVDQSNALTDDVFDPQKAGFGNYTIRYELPAISTCNKPVSELNIEVTTDPYLGNKFDFSVCSKAVSGYTNFDLFYLLMKDLDNAQAQEIDRNGKWTDGPNTRPNTGPKTNEITHAGDSHINLENILDNQGEGNYEFTYTVQSKNPVCNDSSTYVTIHIINPDLSGYALSVSPTAYCLNALYDNNSFDFQLLPSAGISLIYGYINVLVKVTYPNGDSKEIIKTLYFNENAIGTFEYNPTYYLGVQEGEYLLEITKICGNDVKGVSTNFNVNFNHNTRDAIASFSVENQLCPGIVDVKSTVTLSDVVKADVSDGIYKIEYSITDELDVSDALESEIEFKDGKGTFFIPKTKANKEGDYVIEIIKISGNALECNISSPSFISSFYKTSFSLPGYPAPKEYIKNFRIKDDTCAGGKDVEAYIEVPDYGGLAFPNGDYVINFTLEGANISTSPISNNISFKDGLGTFTISKDLTPNSGTTTIKIHKIEGDAIDCNIIGTPYLESSFLLPTDPSFDATTLSGLDTICPNSEIYIQIENIPFSVSVLNLEYTVGGSNTSVNPIRMEGLSTKVDSKKGNRYVELEIPKDYSSEVGNTEIIITRLEDGARTCMPYTQPKPISINVSQTSIVLMDVDDQVFCESFSPIVGDLLPRGENYVWSKKTTPDEILDLDTPLVSGTYTVYIKSGTECFSEKQEVEITVLPITAPILETAQFFCLSSSYDLEALILPEDEDTYRIYSSLLSETPLPTDTELKQGIYWISRYNATFDCETDRTAVDVVFFDDLSTPNVSDVSFCKLDLPTIKDIPLPQSPHKAIYKWYLDLFEPQPLSEDFRINTSNTFYVSQYSSDGGCFSQRKAVNISILSTPSPVSMPLYFASTFFPKSADLFPSGEAFKWYNEFSDTDPITDKDTPIESKKYWLTETNESGCESEKKGIEILLTDPFLGAPGIFVGEKNTINGRKVLDDYLLKTCGVGEPKLADIEQEMKQFLNDDLKIDFERVSWFSKLEAQSQYALSLDTKLEDHNQSFYLLIHTRLDDYTVDLTHIMNVKVDLTDCDISANQLFIPDAFSPNGDQLNDTFNIPDIRFLYPEYNLEIYNRYGILVFEGNELTPPWDGNISDQLAESGLYFYYLTLLGGAFNPIQGTLYLSR